MPSPTSKLLPFLTFLSVVLHVHAGLNLDPSDLRAFSIIKNDLGIDGQLSSFPCHNAGVFCERRLSNNGTYVLRITRLIFNSKDLSGSLSPAIGRLTELKELTVSNNHLVDQVPSQIVDCRKLEILDLQINQFSGKVPSGLSSLIRLRVIDLSSNKFSGSLDFLKYFPNLESLSIANNYFTGKIPASIRSFRNLRVFNFSGNRLLESSTSIVKDVEFYSATEVPKRYVLAENSRTNGTQRATAPATAPTSSAQAPNASPVHKNRKNKAKKIASWILGFIAGAIAGSLSGFIFSLLFKLVIAAIKGGSKNSGPSIFAPKLIKRDDLAFLERDDALASLQLIGKGGCGEVYKAELPEKSGKMFAIKKITQPPKDAAELAEEESRHMSKKMRQIKSEIRTVGEIRHRNLLPLVAHVPRPDCHYLVYELMKNGSLQDMLNQVSAGVKELDWLTRHNIALGVASGLEYLHMNHTPRIIHRDLKPANVLLDDDMEARIADFGLAKAMPDAQTHMTASNVAGTVGYIAPEYHQTLKFTDKCDIYGFGVLLGVLVIGKLPSDEFFQNTDEMSLVKWMKNVMTSDNPRGAIDPKLLGNGWEEQMLLALKIACFCTMDNPKERPNSKEVRCMLSQIKHDVPETPSECV
ncbi:leucine-rich repeat receptor-like serine/threonine/tyrosine-protein kinase SOBIR1 [Cucumis melo var. makuwa]|uniref:Leucine-rich repeat receptor-like serine/threonine/tyrosine-protein kinase SOBIR1 n=2 Tax=Cucumis melo TaxID=3656 RepID=A0A5A7URP1_CUCMM|nr:leucine-rich repeat receptor-like serine/threonine/tyrosine-protein kinase SOBIR1 [Cucumis melo]KAA0057804.1 leucine-rich repeat receptor-like serine/threonine/tyrosine-protein kinase SOBIR1 [Cucumis melo var. makuwa]